MKPTKQYIADAHAKGLYVDRSTGEVFPAIPRTTFIDAVECLEIERVERLNYCQAEICYCGYSELFKCRPTTSQHLAKFRVWLRDHYYRVLNFPIYRRVRDKVGSHIEYEPFIPFV